MARGTRIDAPVSVVRPSGLIVLPSLLNQYEYGWLAYGGGAIALSPWGGTDALANDSSGYGGSSLLGWETALFAGAYVHHGANNTAVVGAARVGWKTPAAASPNGGQRFDSNMILDVVMATGTPTLGSMGYRYWIGLFNQAASLGSLGDAAPANMVAFRYSPNTGGDAGWTAVSRNGGAQSTTPLGVPVVANTAYRLTIRINNGTVTYQVNGANDVNKSGANVPTASSLLWPHGLAVKDVTGAAQLLNMYTQRVLLRIGAASKFR